MKNRGGSQPWRNPQKSLSDKVANHSPACPDSELECLGDMQIIKPNKVLQLLRRKAWPNKMHFSQWQKFSHSTSEIFIHKRQLHVAHNRGTALSPCVQVGKLSYFKIREKNNKHSAAFIFGFCFHLFFFFCMAPYTFEAKYFPFTFSNFSLTGLGFVAVTASAISWPILKDCSFVAPFKSTNMLQEIRHRKSTQFLKIISYSFLVERQGCCSQLYSL